MTPLEFLSQFPTHREFSRKSIILLFAYYLRRHRGVAEFASPDLRSCFAAALLRPPTDLASLLAGLAKGHQSPLLKTKASGGYALSLHGLNEVEAILPSPASSPEQLTTFLRAAVPHLKRVIAKVTDAQRRDFLAEAISCLGVDARRATVVMTWIAAMDHLQEYVVKHELAAFNAALAKRTDRLKKVTVAKRDDFGDMKEIQFIEICRSAGILTNDIRKILDEKLGFRNPCGHPSAISVSESKVVSFIEDVVDNVMAKFAI